MKIISNNPRVWEFAKEHSLNLQKTTTIPEVLEEVRNLIHRNHQLVNHPLTTSIKPYRNLPKTVVLTESSTLHFHSLEIVENVTRSLAPFDKEVPVTPEANEDYQMIDFGVFEQIYKQVKGG